MLKRFFLSSGSVLGYLFTATTALAASSYTPPQGMLNPDVDPTRIPQLGFSLLLYIAGALAIGYLMYGGIKWITSRGDKVAVESARRHIVAAVVGLVVVISAFFILQVVFRILGVQNPLNNALPTLDSSSN
jgi:TRAP-type C4-dicarboxylate transport system permease small subunit